MPLVAPVILPEMFKIFTMAEVRGPRPGPRAGPQAAQPPLPVGAVLAAHLQRADRVAAILV